MSCHDQLAFDFSVARAVPAPPPPGPSSSGAPAKPAAPRRSAETAGGQPANPRSHRGRRNYLAGLAAEDSVARYYERRGFRLIKRRWRGERGELDLVFATGPGWSRRVFVEVKKSSTFRRANDAIHPGQIARILRTGEEYLGHCPPGTGCSFDLALVDAHGQVKVLDGALNHYF